MTEASFWRRRPVVIVLWVASVVVALGVGWWAAAQATQPPQVQRPAVTATTVEVVSGSLSIEQPYGIDVSWPAEPAGANGLAGTLTAMRVASSGTSVQSGDVLYTVDLAPAVAARGTVPAFRDLGPGMRGADVKQLQEFLIERGYLKGKADGLYGASTQSAVDAWTASLHQAKTGTVPLGRLLFLPALPATLAPAAETRIGAQVSPGSALLVGGAGEPQFSFRVLPEAIDRTVPGLQVRIDVEGATWQAEVERLIAATDGTDATFALLRPVPGATSICGDTCADAVNLGGKALLAGTLVLVPPTDGAQVPTASITTDISGVASVTLDDGTRVPVTVLASSDGKSIVEGVEPGDRIVVVTTGVG